MEESLYKKLEGKEGIKLYDIRTNIKNMSAKDVFNNLWEILPDEDEGFEGVSFAVVNTVNGDVTEIYKPKRKKIELLEHNEIIYVLEISNKFEVAACIFGKDTFEKFIPLHTLIEWTKDAVYAAHRDRIRENLQSILFRYPHLRGGVGEMEIRMEIPNWVNAEIAYSRRDGIYWIDAHCDICGGEVRAHKTGYGYVFQCLDCKQEGVLEGVEVKEEDWRVED